MLETNKDIVYVQKYLQSELKLGTVSGNDEQTKYKREVVKSEFW